MSRIYVFSSPPLSCARTQEEQLSLKPHFKTVADRENVGWPLRRAEAPQNPRENGLASDELFFYRARRKQARNSASIEAPITSSTRKT
jgi:hypothetical protein